MDLLTRLADRDLALPLLKPHAAHLLGSRSELERVEVLHAWRKTWAKPQPHERDFLEFHLRLSGRTASGSSVWHGIQGIAGVEAALPPGKRYAHRLILQQCVLCFERLPVDRGLPQLAQLLAQKGCAVALPVAARETLSGPPSKVQLVSYRPGNRAVLRATREPMAVYGKLFADSGHAVLAARLTALQLARHKVPEAPALPQLLGHDAELGVVWMSALPGASGADWLAQQGGGDAFDQLAGRGLAAWHSLPTPVGLTVLTREQLLRECERKLAKLAAAQPDVASVAAQLTDRLRGAADRLSTASPSLIHGDVHPRQLLIDERQQIGLCDLDELALGDPERDLAQLIERTGSAGVARYWSRHSRRGLQPALLRWYLALSHVDRAYREYCARGYAALPSAGERLDRAVRCLA